MTFYKLTTILDETDVLHDLCPKMETESKKADGSISKFPHDLASCTSGASCRFEEYEDDFTSWLSTAGMDDLIDKDRNYGKPVEVFPPFKPETFQDIQEQI